MSLDIQFPNRRPADLPRDKPQVDRAEHGNLDRPGATLHPRAAAARTSGDWSRYLVGPAWR